MRPAFRSGARGSDRALLPWGLALVAALAMVALLAPLIAPYNPNQQIDPVAGRYLPPGASRLAVHLRDGRWLLAERVKRTPGALLLERQGRETEIAPGEVANLSATGVRDHRYFLLGSDQFGRDVFSRLLFGARVSLTIALLAVALSAALGIAIGGIAAIAGSWVDGVLMRIVDALLAFPRLFLLLFLAALVPTGQWIVILVLGATGWMSVARLFRGELLSLKKTDFILASRGLGISPLRVFFRHLLPNAVTPVVVDASLRVGEIILVEAALSFLGLGVQPPTASWGNMVADGSAVLTSAWWLAAFPGLAIALTVISFNLLGDGARARLDPRSAGSAERAEGIALG